MKTIFTATSTGYCIVEDKYYACNGADQIEITNKQKLTINRKISKTGFAEIEIESPIQPEEVKMSNSNVFFVLTSAFSVYRVTSAPVADAVYEMVIRRDALDAFGVQQLVAVAKSMNSELKVNSKQSKESILTAIDEELLTFPIEAVAHRPASEKVASAPRTGTKQICWDAFSAIDMTDKKAARAVIDKLVEEHNLDKRVVQSYASNYRKAQRGE